MGVGGCVWVCVGVGAGGCVWVCVCVGDVCVVCVGVCGWVWVCARVHMPDSGLRIGSGYTVSENNCPAGTHTVGEV